MDYYIILRKTNNVTQYLYMTDCGKHVWVENPNIATAFNAHNCDKKVANLRKYGKKLYFYHSKWVYYQKDIF